MAWLKKTWVEKATKANAANFNAMEEGTEEAKVAAAEAKAKAETVKEAQIENGAVTAAKLGAEAVEAAAIKTGAVTAPKLGAESVETAKVKLLAITAGLLGAEAVETAKIKLLAITAGLLASEAVEESKLKKEAVTVTKVKAPTVPVASGTESLTAEVGTGGVVRRVIAVYNAKAEASAKVKIKHALNSEYVTVEAWKASAKKATEKITPDGAAVAGAISKVKYVSAEEIELTLVSTVPSAKEELFYIVSA